MVPPTKQHMLKKFKILVVEDNNINQKVAKITLEKMNQEVDVANHGVEALELVKNNNYHLIFMDMQMPVMGGLEATIKIRELDDKIKSSTPIIALTSNMEKDSHKKCLAVGMNHCLTKPFDPLKVIEILEIYQSK